MVFFLFANPLTCDYMEKNCPNPSSLDYQTPPEWKEVPPLISGELRFCSKCNTSALSKKAFCQ